MLADGMELSLDLELVVEALRLTEDMCTAAESGDWIALDHFERRRSCLIDERLSGRAVSGTGQCLQKIRSLNDRILEMLQVRHQALAETLDDIGAGRRARSAYQSVAQD